MRRARARARHTLSVFTKKPWVQVSGLRNGMVMVPVLHAGTPHRVSLRGFERSHPQLCRSAWRWNYATYKYEFIVGSA